MASTTAATAGQFDDSNINWQPLAGIDDFVMSICSVDKAKNSVDFIARFAPNSVVLFHRHLAETHTFVIEGDHVIYEPDNSMRVSRAAGIYTVTPASDDIHSEGGGPNGCVLMYSVRSDNGDLFEMLDDQFQSTGTMTLDDFEALAQAGAA